MISRIWIPAIIILAFGTAVPSRAAPKSSFQQHTIDTHQSVMTVRVYKTGLLSGLAHDHEISAPISSGTVDTGAQRTEIHVDAAAMRVRDAKVSDKDRAEIQKTMLGPQVLDSEHHREIVFHSTATEPAGAGSWKVHGDLTLHGQTRPVTVEVSEKEGRYTGYSLLKQTDFGITPIQKGGGTIRVKDEVRIEFDIRLAK